MDRVALSFRDKVGTVMTSFGLGCVFLGFLILVSWFFMPLESRSQINIAQPLVALVFTGIVLVRLSLLTIKK